MDNVRVFACAMMILLIYPHRVYNSTKHVQKSINNMYVRAVILTCNREKHMYPILNYVCNIIRHSTNLRIFLAQFSIDVVDIELYTFDRDPKLIQTEWNTPTTYNRFGMMLSRRRGFYGIEEKRKKNH